MSNWEILLEEYEGLIGRYYKHDRTGDICHFFGLVHSDDYYYGLFCKGKLTLLSCVGDLEQFGYILIGECDE